MTSMLKKKSDKLIAAANLLHDNDLYPAVAHSAYYCCLQLMKHIWLHSLHKTESELQNTKGSTHKILIKQTGKHIKSLSFSDFYIFRRIRDLKDLRVDADYSDKPFDKAKSSKSLELSNSIVQILKKY
jgi:uncharacterized protein (UPF0332 family)